MWSTCHPDGFNLAGQDVRLGVAVISLCAVLGLVIWTRVRPAVSLLDFSCFSPSSSLNVGSEELSRLGVTSGFYSEESIAFQQKLLARSGVADTSCFPEGLTDGLRQGKRPNLEAAKAESELVLYTVVEDLLRKTGISPSEVDIVIVSCSCFGPTPSLAAMVVNRFDMKESTLTYNLGGMGCSSSVIAVDLAKHLLTALPRKRVLIVNHENVTNCLYTGNQKNMLITNVLFRIGGACAIMSNRPDDSVRAKYRLVHTVRTHLGRHKDAFSCMGDAEDTAGMRGIHLQRNVVAVAQKALTANLRLLGPLVLPLPELLRAASRQNYVPNFKRAFERFLLHTGGRGVIESIQEGLSLSSKDCQASYDTLHRFGNTSAASTWYILANLEHTGSINKGDRIWQLGFGGGFKCNSAVWKACRSIRDHHACWQ
ncbi:hypothetical protein CVIRNUC_000228 [Coccomyxa viridis]|uniref:3-ketoacyl-CoA synthase n=1 Tax=Coccomyxa viridis TaxID=1274662 RepID=A0AAV1HTK5_9CHLO|nr:hypothetical protein CVIRNUC_000228 [Coccomyxa viridis]